MSSSIEQVEPLDGFDLVAHWAFVHDTDDSWATGEFLLRNDGALLRRSGGSSYERGFTTYKFDRWEPVTWWGGISNADASMAVLKARGYDLSIPGPTLIESSVAGPFAGIPKLARYL